MGIDKRGIVMIVICELRVKNSYKDDYIVISQWRDVDKQGLIKHANDMLKEILCVNMNAKIEYKEEHDDTFGGRTFYTATILVGMCL